MINFKAKAVRLAVLGGALAVGLGALAAAAPAQAETVAPSGTTTQSQVTGVSAHLLPFGAAPISASSSATFRFQSFIAKAFCIGADTVGSGMDLSLQEYECSDNPRQAWHVKDLYNVGGVGYYQFENGVGGCLGVQAGSNLVGAKLVSWNCLSIDGHPDQFWAIGLNTLTGSACFGDFYLQNLFSGLVVGTQSGVSAENTPLVQWLAQGICNNQIWDFD